MHEVLVNHLGGLSLPRKSVVRLTYRPDMTLDVYRGRKQQCNNNNYNKLNKVFIVFYLILHRKSYRTTCSVDAGAGGSVGISKVWKFLC